MRKLNCPQCGAPVEEDGFHPDLGIARCGHCRAVMDLVERPERAVRRRREVPIPAKFRIESRGDRLAIAWRWFSPVHVFLLLFCLVWDGGLVFWYAAAAKAGASVDRVMLLFPLLHVAAGVGLSWFTLAGLLNTTRLEIERGFLRIRHGPIPWPGNRQVPAKGLQQLFAREVVHRGKNGNRHYTYDLMALLRPDGRQLKLVGMLEKPEQALFLEQRIEDHLDLVDAAVEGAIARG